MNLLISHTGALTSTTGVLSIAIAKQAMQVLGLPVTGNPDHYKKQQSGGG
jgi:hypothetical protein